MEAFAIKEKKKIEQEIAHNLLEAAVYDWNSKLDEKIVKEFGTEEEFNVLSSLIHTLKEWIENNVTLETTTEEFKEKKAELDKLTKKINFRRKQKDVSILNLNNL